MTGGRAIGFYNGWSGDERLAVLPILDAAIAAGTLASATRCSICMTSGSSDWRASDAIVFHDEDYGRPLDAYPVCKPCHRLIHLRFWRVDEWQAHIAQNTREGAWFIQLTLDPASRYRPFVETYPDRLPAPFTPQS